MRSTAQHLKYGIYLSIGYTGLMTKRNATYLPDTPFWSRYQGRFTGILNWPDIEAFWDAMNASSGEWYVFAPEQMPPKTPASNAEFTGALAAATALINTRRDRSHCGAVYVDDTRHPAFVKIFDPAAMGSSCSISTAPIMPRWIISRVKPDPLPPVPLPAKPGLFKRLAGRAYSALHLI